MFKPFKKPKAYTTRDIYNYYIKTLLESNSNYITRDEGNKIKKVLHKDTREVIVTFKQFKAVIALMHKKATASIINGYSYDLLNGMGYLFVIRKERRPDSPRLNRNASYKLRKELKEKGTLTEHNWKIFYQEDDYCKTHWFKPSTRFIRSKYCPDIKIYSFKPVKQFRIALGRTILVNPTVKAFYPFVPLPKAA